jgi:hypothetical protein
MYDGHFCRSGEVAPPRISIGYDLAPVCGSVCPCSEGCCRSSFMSSSPSGLFGGLIQSSCGSTCVICVLIQTLLVLAFALFAHRSGSKAALACMRVLYTRRTLQPCKAGLCFPPAVAFKPAPSLPVIASLKQTILKV